MNIARTQPQSTGLPPQLVAAAVLWCAVVGSGSVATKIANSGISPVFQAGLRSLIASLLVLGYCWFRGKKFNFFDASLWPGLLAGTFFALEFWMLFEGLNYTSVARGTLFLYTAPFFVAPIAHWVLPNDKLNTKKMIGLLVAFMGLLIAFADRLWLSSNPAIGAASTLKGDLLCLGAALFWGISTIIVKGTRLRSEAPEKNLLYQLMTSSVVLLIAAWLLGEKGIFAPSAKVWFGFAYQTVVVASAGYLLWFTLIARFSASTLHAFTFLSPIFGVVAATLLLQEPLGWNIVGSLVLVALGLYLVNRS